MDDVVHPPPALRRRNSIPAVPPKLIVLPCRSSATTSSSSDDLELLAIRPAGSHSYISLRDLLPALAVNSPKPKTAALPGSDICIRNRLVKQAAWAYLQPMSSSSSSSCSNGGGFLSRVWPRVVDTLDFIRRGVVRLLSWMLRIGSR